VTYGMLFRTLCKSSNPLGAEFQVLHEVVAFADTKKAERAASLIFVKFLLF